MQRIELKEVLKETFGLTDETVEQLFEEAERLSEEIKEKREES